MVAVRRVVIDVTRAKSLPREGDVLTVTGPIDSLGDSMCSPGSIFVAEQVEVVVRASAAPVPSR